MQAGTRGGQRRIARIARTARPRRTGRVAVDAAALTPREAAQADEAPHPPRVGGRSAAWARRRHAGRSSAARGAAWTGACGDRRNKRHTRRCTGGPGRRSAPRTASSGQQRVDAATGRRLGRWDVRAGGTNGRAGAEIPARIGADRGDAVSTSTRAQGVHGGECCRPFATVVMPGPCSGFPPVVHDAPAPGPVHVHGALSQRIASFRPLRRARPRPTAAIRPGGPAAAAAAVERRRRQVHAGQRQ